ASNSATSGAAAGDSHSHAAVFRTCSTSREFAMPFLMRRESYRSLGPLGEQRARRCIGSAPHSSRRPRRAESSAIRGIALAVVVSMPAHDRPHAFLLLVLRISEAAGAGRVAIGLKRRTEIPKKAASEPGGFFCAAGFRATAIGVETCRRTQMT